MSTTVKQTYTPSLNVSVTKKNGRITKLTTWTTLVPKSTQRTFSK